MPLRSLDMTDQDIENALRPGAAGGLSLQQIPYDCPDPSFEFTTDDDVLKPAIEKSHQVPPKNLAKKKTERDQAARPIPVPNLDDVQPFMSVPDFVEKPGSKLETLLASQHIQNPYPFPGNIDALSSLRAEYPGPAYSRHLRECVEHALAHFWKYDPVKCSVKAASKFAQDSDGRPSHGLTKEEYAWVTGGKVTAVKKARGPAQADVELAIKDYQRMRSLHDEDDDDSINGTDLDRELDKFYGPDGTDSRPIDDDSDEGFSEPNAITTTIVSLPDKSLMEDGVTPGGIFQDSGISMDEGYAEYSRAHSVPNTAKEPAGKVPNDWPSFKADVAPFRTPKQNGRWLGLIGDQMQCEWPGRRQGPYDLQDLRFRDANPIVKGLCSDVAPENHLPAQITLPNESVERTQEASRRGHGKVASDSSETESRSSSQDKSALLHGNKGDSITKGKMNSVEPSVGAAGSTSKDRPQSSLGSIETGGDIGISVSGSHVPSKGVPMSNDTSAHARRSTPYTSFTTPMSQRFYQIDAVQMNTPATPETINIYLSPEHKSASDADDDSDDSHQIQVPNSATSDTPKGQSVLDRYIQETRMHPDLARHNSNATSLDGSESDELSLGVTQQRSSSKKRHAVSSEDVAHRRKKSKVVFTLSPTKTASQENQSPCKIAPIPVTPANRTDTAPFRPMTPFQLRTPAHQTDFDSPGTPTPAPRTSKAKAKSVMNVFRSPKLGSRSPERTKPDSDIASTTTPTSITAAAVAAGTHDLYGGSQGLLFQPARKSETGTKNVLNSLQLSPERGSDGHGEGLDDYEDELAGGTSNEKRARRSTPKTGAKVAKQHVERAAGIVVVPRVRPRDEMLDESLRDLEPRRKKLRPQRRFTRGTEMDL